MRTNSYSRPVEVEILSTTSTRIVPGQVYFCIFELTERGVPQRFYLSRDGVKAVYQSGGIVGVLSSAFNPSVLEVGTMGPTFHHLKVLNADADLGFKPKVTAPMSTGPRW